MGRLGKILLTSLFAVLTVFATVTPTQAATLHPFDTSGLNGVDANGFYARSSLDGKRTVAVRTYIRDEADDGKYAGVEVRWKSASGKTDIKYAWNPNGTGTEAVTRVQSFYYVHLYVRECVGVGKEDWRPVYCGPFLKQF